MKKGCAAPPSAIDSVAGTMLKSAASAPLSVWPVTFKAAAPVSLIVSVVVIARPMLASPILIVLPAAGDEAYPGWDAVAVTTTSSGVGSARPKLSVRASVKVSTASALGAMKVDRVFVALADSSAECDPP